MKLKIMHETGENDISKCVWEQTQIIVTAAKNDTSDWEYTSLDTYLQFLHFSPNNIPFPHTMHVWDIQYLVENLWAKEERVR